MTDEGPTKQCRYCRSTIDKQALVCKECNHHQGILAGRAPAYVGLAISIVMMVIALGQLNYARSERVEAAKAFQSAEEAFERSQQALAEAQKALKATQRTTTELREAQKALEATQQSAFGWLQARSG